MVNIYILRANVSYLYGIFIYIYMYKIRILEIINEMTQNKKARFFLYI
jgi:hypothetical protein